MTQQVVYHSPNGVTPDGKCLSAAAGIVDDNTVVRIVVTEPWRMRLHAKRNERIFIVPDFWVDEAAICADNWHLIVEPARKHALKCLSGPNPCGECRACCVAPPIKFEEYTKKAHEPCCHLCDHGCSKYKKRPRACREFECSWLKSQYRNDVMAPELRPNHCGVFFIDRDTVGGDPLVFEVHPDPSRPDVINSPLVRSYIDEMQRAGYKAKLITHYAVPT